MIVLASCDISYFRDHYESFYFSAKSCGYEPHINIINPDDEILNSNIENVTYSYGPNSKVFYSINRFLIAENYIKNGVLVTDIDCIFNEKMQEPKEDIGLFLRKNNPNHMKVAAGIVWLNNTKNAKIFIDKVKNYLYNSKQVWFVDQLALYRAYLDTKSNLSCFEFSQMHMDWEFIDSSLMWTGKGNRKFNNLLYKEKKEEYSGRFKSKRRSR